MGAVGGQNEKRNWVGLLIPFCRLDMFKIRQQLLKQKLAADPYYRFQSLAEVTIAGEMGVRIEVNEATVDDWLRLPGISIHQARQLVTLVQSGLSFLAIEDLAAALNLPIQQLKPLQPILSFTYRDPESLLNPAKVPINQATVEQLQGLPFMTPAIAAQIVQSRQQQGRFQHLADLQQRLNLPPEVIAQVMHFIQF